MKCPLFCCFHYATGGCPINSTQNIQTHGEAYEKYFSPLKTQFIKNEILNKVKMKYVEGCVLNENLFGTSEQNEGEFNGEPAE